MCPGVVAEYFPQGNESYLVRGVFVRMGSV